MMENSNRPVGLTKDAGYQIGVRRTLPIRYEDAWRVLTSPVGIQMWLGTVSKLNFTEGARYELNDGTVGEIKVFSPNSHLRITWQSQGWSKASTIQLRVIPKGDKTVVAFHQEHLPGPKERAERREHYKAALDNLERIIRSV